MNNRIIKFIVIFFILGLGVLLRIRAYSINCSFFLDEILLAFNVIGKNYKELLLPLNYEQSAPFLFLFANKMIISKFGIGELSFRFIPFISSILSLFAFYFLSKKILTKFWTQMLATFLFSINFTLLLLSQTFKQYSSDVLITILILLVALTVDIKKISYPKIFGLGLLVSLAFCFSFPTLFVVAGIMIIFAIYTREYKKILVFITPNLLTLGAYMLTTLDKVKSSAYLNQFWSHGYNVFSLNQEFENFNVLFSFYKDPLIFLVLGVLGFIYLYKNDKIKSLIFVSPVIVTFFAGYFKIYPFAGRLIIFLFPILLLLIIIPVDKLKFKRNIFNIAVFGLSFIFFINYFTIYFNSYAANKITFIRQDVKPLLSILAKEKKKSDVLYLYYGSNKSYLYYNMLFELPKDNIYIGAAPQNDEINTDLIKNDMKNLDKNTIWFLFVRGSDSYEKDVDKYKKWLLKNGKIQKDVVLKGARLIKAKTN